MNLEDLNKLDKEYLKPEEQFEMENFIAYNLEKSLDEEQVEQAKVHMEFYEQHHEKYICRNVKRYLNLKNRFNNLLGSKK